MIMMRMIMIMMMMMMLQFPLSFDLLREVFVPGSTKSLPQTVNKSISCYKVDS